ncbi:MAG: hypothetical protein JSV65_04860 [Armatimonadota bacterium]|nr:MAG: hypothetical protein JSV65_04860 [Armatimonadota bacterium]
MISGSSLRYAAAAALLLMCVAAGGAVIGGQIPQDDYPYPMGREFPLGLYSLEVRTEEELLALRDQGWNMGHTYGEQVPLMDKLARAGMFAFENISEKEEAAAQAEIERLAAYDCHAWWDLPEERRWWREDEFSLIKDLSAWTRKRDPMRRPNFMYIPGHYSADDIARYVPYLDIIGAGAYTEYAHQPRAWVRWRVESEIEAIKQAGFTVGRDYLNGERVPIAVLMCFQQGRYEGGNYIADLKQHDIITPVEAYHDFYCALAAGARGVLVFSYYHRNDLDVLRETFAAYSKAASEVIRSELGQALLFGEAAPVTVEITKGPQRTCSFRPVRAEEDISYPSVNARAVRWQGNLYVIAVNSAEFAAGVSAVLAGLPSGVEQAEVMSEDRTVPVSDGRLADDFPWLGVHVYRMSTTESP